MTYDTGRAPNPFHGYCTLATCKPRIRKTAQIGDWIIGTGSKNLRVGSREKKKKGIDRSGHLIYAMRVTEAMTYDEYWHDPRFRDKRPCMGRGIVGEFGDNLYYRNLQTNQLEKMDWPYHCLPGEECRDTSVDRVLISDDFIYLGGDGPPMPPEFLELVYTGRGHKCRLPEENVQKLVQWLRGTGDKGVVGKPTDWQK